MSHNLLILLSLKEVFCKPEYKIKLTKFKFLLSPSAGSKELYQNGKAELLQMNKT